MNSTNPFIYSDDNKRYHTLNYYNKSSFNSKVFKAVIDAGFTCPNKDGTKGCVCRIPAVCGSPPSPKNRTVKSTTA